MSDKQGQNQKRETAKKRPAIQADAPVTTPAEAMLQGADFSPIGTPADLPNNGNSLRLRQTRVIQMQRLHGNAAVQRLMSLAGGDDTSKSSHSRDLLQREGESEGQSAGEGSAEQASPGGEESPGAETPAAETTEEPGEGEATPQGEGGGEGEAPRGAAGIQGASEDPYDVTGETLDDITGQLTQLDGFAAESSTPLGMSGQVVPERLEDGSYRVTVPWTINNPVVRLPQWVDRDRACEAAQQEWDRFIRQTRIHEQSAHVDAANQILADLPEADRVITAPTRDELIRLMQEKQQEIAGRIQTHHDGCDHGAAIDAILHPDNGRCDSGEE